MQFHRFSDASGHVIKFAALEKITFAELLDPKTENGQRVMTLRIHFLGGPSLEVMKLPESDAYKLMDEISRHSSPALA